jgi:cytochrome b6-f complex iron-sulfur subunit
MSEATSPSETQLSLNRRELLNYAWLASLGVLLVNVGGIGFLFSMPRFKEGEFGGTFVLGPASNTPPVGSPPVNNPKGKFWLTHPEDGIVALYKVCTHLGCLYAWRDQEGKFIFPATALNSHMTAPMSEARRPGLWIVSSSSLSPLKERLWLRPI